MTPTPTRARRPIFALVLLALLLGLGAAAPLPAARANGFEETVFRSNFDELAAGALAGTPVTVEVGTALAAPAPVQVAAVPGLDGRALAVTGAGAAELRFSSYPGGLPQALNSQRYELRVRAELVAPAANTKGAGLYLLTAGGQRFEIVSFGADGSLARGGASLGLAYTAGARVKVDASFDLKNGLLGLRLETAAGSLGVERIGLPGGFNPDTVAALRYAAEGASGSYGIDRVDVRAQKEDDDDRPPPARIVITPPAQNTTVIEVVNNITLVNFNIVLQNSGGRAKGVFLNLEVDDDDLELLDLSWVSGIGYVKEIRSGLIVIGIGEYNAIRKDTYNLKFKFKLKERPRGELKLDIKYRLSYSDSGGRRETQPVVVVIVLPPPGAVPTAVPATATPTVTGTPPTATPSPTATGTPPTATPTVTGTPPTATPTAEPPSPTPTATGGAGG